MTITLEQLPVGGQGYVRTLPTGGNLRRRLLDFGMIEGTAIHCIHRSRGPILFAFRGTMLAFRREDCRRITVEVLP